MKNNAAYHCESTYDQKLNDLDNRTQDDPRLALLNFSTINIAVSSQEAVRVMKDEEYNVND